MKSLAGMLHGSRVIEAAAEGRALHGGEAQLPDFENVAGGHIVKCRAGSDARISFFEAESSGNNANATQRQAVPPEIVWHKTVGTEFRNTEALRRACSLLPASDLEVSFFGCFDYMGRRCAVVRASAETDDPDARGIRGQTSSSLQYIMNEVLGLPPAAVDVVSNPKATAGEARLVKVRSHACGERLVKHQAAPKRWPHS